MSSSWDIYMVILHSKNSGVIFDLIVVNYAP